MMRAVQLSRFGGPEVLNVVDIAPPAPGPGQVLVRTRAAGVNFADVLMRQDRYAVSPPLPGVLGQEVTGVVEAVGAGVGGVVEGARVAAPLFAANMSFGGYAEWVVIDAGHVAPIPDELSFEVATALMVQGLSALYLIKQAPPKGKRVLINAAAGGVGTLLAQLARRAGAASVIAAASSADKLDLARSLGADIGIDYTQPHWGDALLTATGGAGPDLIYESVGADVTMESLRVLAPLGQIVIYGALNIQQFDLGVPDLLGLIFKNQSLTGFALTPLLTPAALRSGLAELFGLAVREELRVTIGGVFPFEQAADAHRALESRASRGKIILTP
jgi:NADPH2:quinone reductase